MRMTTNVLPWHRVPMVWLLITLPTIAVVAGFITLWLALRSDDGVVVDDYYRQGKEINLTLRRDQAAQTLGLHGHMEVTANEVRIRLQSNETLPPSVQLQLLHATRQGNDRAVVAPLTADGTYRVSRGELTPGRYYVQLATNNWRLLGSLSLPGSTNIELTPGGGARAN